MATKKNGAKASTTTTPTLTEAPLARVVVAPTPVATGPRTEPDEHIVYYSPFGGAVFAALHDDTPENHANVMEAERMYDREGRAYKKIRVRTVDLPPHAQGGHDIGRLFVRPDGTVEVRS